MWSEFCQQVVSRHVIWENEVPPVGSEKPFLLLVKQVLFHLEGRRRLTAAAAGQFSHSPRTKRKRSHSHTPQFPPPINSLPISLKFLLFSLKTREKIISLHARAFSKIVAIAIQNTGNFFKLAAALLLFPVNSNLRHPFPPSFFKETMWRAA